MVFGYRVEYSPIKVENLGNVDVNNLSDQQVLIYDISRSLWSNASAAIIDTDGDIFVPRQVMLGSNGFYTGLRASSLLAASYELTLPATAGTAGQILSTDGTGITQWVSPSAPAAGGAANSIQYNNAGVIDGSTIFSQVAGNLELSGGSMRLADTVPLALGAGLDLMLVHDGANSAMHSTTGDLSITNTNAAGKTQVRLGSTSAASAFEVQNSGPAVLLKVDGSGQVDVAGNLDVSGGVDIDADNTPLTIGAGQDLTLTHSGAASSITSATGELLLRNTDAAALVTTQLGSSTTATASRVINQASVELFKVYGNGQTTAFFDATVQGSLFSAKSTTVLATAAADTYTADFMVGGVIERDPNGADRNDVTDTAANIVAAVADAAVGSSFEFSIENTADADERITLSPGPGVTTDPVSIKRGEIARCLVIVTNVAAPAVVVKVISRSAQESNVVVVRSEEDFPVAVAGFHVLRANTTYVVDAAVTMTNGIEFDSNTALKGAGYSSSLTFSPDTLTGFKSVSQNVFISDLTVFNGGNNATGLFDLTDINYAVDPAVNPFMGRSKRVFISGNNFFGITRYGKVDGFGTININNNFMDGQQTKTEEGWAVSNGLSMKFNGNKVVLWKGTTAANSGTMLKYVANNTYVGVPAPPATYPGPGFNATLVQGDILNVIFFC